MAAMGTPQLIRNVPQRLLQDEILFHTWLNLSRNLKLSLLITQDHFLYEVRDKEILSCCSLKKRDKNSGQNGSSIINGDFYSHFTPIRH